jgi:ParB-like chromosome segregation protein Spo0J
MPDPMFDQLREAIDARGAEAALDLLIERLRREKRYHELCDALLMQARLRLGLPVILTGSLDDLPEPLRTQTEEACIAAYREVGRLLMDAGRVREAWMYLRAVSDRSEVAAALAEVKPTEENTDEIIEVALHEGVAPRLGFELLLAERGICNAITMYDGTMHARPLADRQQVAALLVRHLHADLLRNLLSDIRARQDPQPQAQDASDESASIGQLVAGREWLFAEHNYHIDTTHLAAVVRFSLIVEDEDILRLAIDLTEYGRRLDPQFQFAGETPFEDVYPSHALFFWAMLGQQVDEALQYFRSRAEGADVESDGTAAAEVYVALLARLSRNEQAIQETVRLIPAGVRTAGFAPSLLELAARAGQYDALLDACRQRGDFLAYTAGLIAGERAKT